MDEIIYSSAASLARAIRDKEVSATEVIQAHLKRIEEVNPKLNAIVVPVDDAIKGTKPVAFAVRRPGTTVDEAALKEHALEHAPAYQHPRRVWFVEALPLASTGKIDRAALRRRAEEAVRAR